MIMNDASFPASVPFNSSSLAGRELEYIAQAIENGQISGDQGFSRRCQSSLEETLGTPCALVTTSCTHALEMAAMLLELGEGDEVIVPSFTFVSTANAFVVRGAKPVFCDIRPDTLNLDEKRLEALVSPRTKAIVPVHYAGVGCEMDSILAIAQRHGLAVVEDNAHGLFGKYKGRWLGTMGVLSALSFHETKNITCGEGGALLINEPLLKVRAEIMREKGTNRARFFRGEVDKYSWVDIGSSYVMSDVLAAFLFGQLEKWSTTQALRKAIWQLYDSELGSWADAQGIQRPFVPEHCEQAFHMYYLLMPSLEARSAFIAHLAGNGIKAVFHYLPLHLSDYAKKKGLGAWSSSQKAECPISESVSDRLVRLPFYTSMPRALQENVISAALTFYV